MLLEPEEAKRFYQVWWPLLTFVNQQRGLVKNWPSDTVIAARGVKVADALPLRDALWSDDSLLTQFVTENPARLSDEDLALAASWKHRVSGDFAVFKQLKKHAIVLGDEQKGYAVLGLLSSFEEMLPEMPLYVKTTLLPFEDRIVYDGILVSAPFFLGPGIRANLASDYKGIQESVGLITSLPNRGAAVGKRLENGNAQLVTAFRAWLIGSGVSDKKAAEHAANMAQLGAEMAQETPPRPLWLVDLPTAHRYVADNSASATSIKRFAKFLFDTGRGTVDTVFDLQDIRKR